jgi:hypothetical protein
MARRMEQTPWQKQIFIGSSIHGIGLQHRTGTLLMKSFIKQFQIILGLAWSCSRLGGLCSHTLFCGAIVCFN